MSGLIKLAGKSIPASVALPFREAKPFMTDGGATAYHNGHLAAAVIGALRKRGFLTPGYGPVTVESGQRRTISMLTELGVQALAEVKAMAPAYLKTVAGK
jgi:hypothetical protein